MAVEAETFERAFAVGDVGELVLSNISGAVEVRAWDHPEIKVSGSKRPGGVLPWISPEEGFRATRIEMEQQGSRVIVRTTRQREGFWHFVQWLAGVAQVDYMVWVPRRCSVVVDLVSGRLSVEDVSGSVMARTVAAGQSLRRLDGNLVASTVSGAIAAEDLRGKAAMRTVSGGIRALQSHFASLSTRTVSGSIEVATPLEPTGTYEFQSVSGSIRLSLPADTRCSAELHSVSGSIRSELPGQVQEIRRGQWRAEINGGGARVRVQSVSGGLRLVAAERVEALPEREARPVPAEPAPTGQEPTGEEPVDRESIMMMILEAVERGELSVDEAAIRLAELDTLAVGGQAVPIPAPEAAERPAEEAGQPPAPERQGEQKEADGR